MATNTQAKAAREVQAPDYSVVGGPVSTHMDPEARLAPTCMWWAVAIGVGLLVCMVLTWVVANLGTIDWGLLFH